MIKAETDFKTCGALNLPSPVFEWNTLEHGALGYCVDAVLVEAEGGGYVASIAQLRGVISEGDDKQSALRNIKEAFRATIETYNEGGMPIPWEAPTPKEPNEHRVRVAVHV
jgi:predicted RNase H-like HicB family nuclease